MATAAATVVPIEEYLETPYHPDCDFVDGELEERNLGVYEHGTLQMELAESPIYLDLPELFSALD